MAFSITLTFKRTRDRERFHDNPHSKEHGNTMVVGLVYGDGVEAIRAAALVSARKVFGEKANLAVASPFTLVKSDKPAKGAYMATMKVREILDRELA